MLNLILSLLLALGITTGAPQPQPDPTPEPSPSPGSLPTPGRGPSPSPGPVPMGVTEVVTPVGTPLRVTVGKANPSIGDNYFLVDDRSGDTATLTMDKGRIDKGCAPGGCSQDVYVDIDPKREGTFTFKVQYCLRSTLEQCDKAGREPVSYNVTVLVVE